MSSTHRNINLKSFVLNYAAVYFVIIIAFIVFVANIPLHETYIFPSPLQCEDTSTGSKMQAAARLVLEGSESCTLTSPCVESSSLECRAEIALGHYIGRSIGDDRMLFRVFKTLRPFGVNSYQGNTDFKSNTLNLLNLNFMLILLVYGIMMTAGLAAMFALWRQKLLRQTFAFPITDRKKSLLYPALIAFAYVLVMFLLSTMLEQIYPWQKPEEMNVFDMLDTPTLLLLAVVLAPLVEELLFRGVVLRLFVERARPILGSVLISAVFASLHGFVEVDLPWQLFRSVSYFFVSLILCWLYIKNKTLWSPIIFHSAYNGVLISMYLLSK